MTTQPLARTIESLFHAITATVRGATDANLLGRFISLRDEEAFAALMQRHGPMVMGLCRRLLPNVQDAEDAFQATFLVLALKATSIHPPTMVGNWLYGVARTTALKARRRNAQRAAREQLVAVFPEPEAASREHPDHDLAPIIDHELSQLPDHYRAILVLCVLEGLTRQEASRRLGWPEGSVNSRLARARALLARRLKRRGIALSCAVLAGEYPAFVTASVPPAVAVATIRLASLVAEAGTVTAGAVPAGVAHLTTGVARTMFVTKLKAAVAVLLVLAGLSLGGVVSLRALADGRRRSIDPPSTPAKNNAAAKLEDNQKQPAAKPEDNLKNTLLALDKHMWEASAKGNWQERAKFYADDLVTISVLGKFGKKDNIASDKRLRCADWTIRDAEVVPTSKDTAVLYYRYSCKITSNDGTVLETRKDCRASYVWANRNGGWVLVFCFDDHGGKPNDGIIRSKSSTQRPM